MSCNIHFLGVWDTVAALGIPVRWIDVMIDRVPIFRHRFHDLKLSRRVLHGRHAVSIDDERKTFHPKLWDPDIADDHQTMKQIWFSGMHTDVGGGYREQGLSDIALTWLVNEAKSVGLRIYHDNGVSIDPDPYGMMHDSRAGFLQGIYKQARRSWDVALRGKPVVHESVVVRSGRIGDYKPWILELPHDVEPWPHAETPQAHEVQERLSAPGGS